MKWRNVSRSLNIWSWFSNESLAARFLGLTFLLYAVATIARTRIDATRIRPISVRKKNDSISMSGFEPIATTYWSEVAHLSRLP